MFDAGLHRRRSLRLTGYDYTGAGFYSVTICVQGHESLLGDIVNDKVIFHDAGQMVVEIWGWLSQRFPELTLDEFIVMPNHFHGILVLGNHPVIKNPRRGESCIRPGVNVRTQPRAQDPGDHKDRPYGIGSCNGGGHGTSDGSLGRIIQAFKSLTTNAYIHGVNTAGWPPFPGRLWQRNYYERIIRDDDELHNIRQYIRDNPRRWETDHELP